MRERGIIFSAPMVRALLAGTKTQTRRVVKPPRCAAEWDVETLGRPVYRDSRSGAQHDIDCPYGQPGDRLYVKETHAPQADCWGAWAAWMDGDRCKPLPIIHYRASFEPFQDGQGFMIRKPFIERWRSALHMPRWASRITLELTDVRVERLQDISDADAQAEGCSCYVCGRPLDGLSEDDCHCFHRKASASDYRHLWESINGAGSWSVNPWVWVLTFKRV